jgi:UTP--glucose-1-phosphate uridylyltransferase
MSLAKPPLHLQRFGERLREYRDRRRLSREQLAREATISASYVFYLENGERQPTRLVVAALADTLGLSPEERSGLLSEAGFPAAPESVVRDAAKAFQSVLEAEIIPEAQREELLREVQQFVLRWRRQREARMQDVRKAVITAAGWQPKLLAPKSLELTLVHAAEEAARAGVETIVIVAAAETPDKLFDNLSAKFSRRMVRAVQERPRGLGDAVLSAREHVGEEPFAVILPDDIDPTRNTLKEMIGQYRRVRKPLIAVNPASPKPALSEARHYGVVKLGDPVAGVPGVYSVAALEEKPLRAADIPAGSTIIVGRYILTPEVFTALQSVVANPRTLRLELTDALARLRETQPICACELKNNLLPLAPVREVIEKLIHSIRDRSRFEHIVRLTENLLREIELN